MDRQHTAKYQMPDSRNYDFVPGTPPELISLVWPLTLEAASLNKLYDAKRRLQRYVTGVTRRNG